MHFFLSFFGPRIFSFKKKTLDAFSFIIVDQRTATYWIFFIFQELFISRADLHFISFSKETFIYLAVSSLNCGTQDLSLLCTGSLLWTLGQVGSLVVPCRLSCHAACGIWVPWWGIKPTPTLTKAHEALSLNHWTPREFPILIFLICKK